MNLIEFLKIFPTEQACIAHFKRMKERKMMQCEQCGGIVHYWLANKLMHECKGCKRRISIRSGTYLAHTKLPFQYWYLALHLMTATKKGISALEMRRQLGHKRYEPVFRMMHKIRAAMGKRDDRYLLNDMIEVDDAYIETCTEEVKKKNLKRGKGSQRQTKTTVMAESILLEDIEKGTLSNPCRYFKMIVNPSETSENMEDLMTQHVSKQAVVFSDHSTAYVTVHKAVKIHVMKTSKISIEMKTLKWVHIAISNVKRTLLGIYHSVSESYLQSYLNEFCYKLNRRYFGRHLFDRAILAIIPD